MFRNTQTYILVSLITLLIWVLAEAESVATRSRSVDIVFAGDPDGVRAVRVLPEENFDGPVTLELQGPSAHIDEVVDALPHPLVLTPDLLGLPLGEGRISVDLAAAVGRHPVFEGTGVRPSQVRPATVAVMFDDLVTREMRVAPPQLDGLDLESAPEVSPRAVTVRLPASVADDLSADASVQAVLEPSQVARLAPGRPQSLAGVRVEFPAVLRGGPYADFLRADPATVTVNLTRRGDSARTVVASVPVRLQIAPIDQPQWDISVTPESVSDVEVSGPRDLIGQIESGKVQVFAIVPLTWAELEAAGTREEPLSKDVTFLLSSEAVVPAQFRATDRAARVTVRRRSIVGPPPPDGGQ